MKTYNVLNERGLATGRMVAAYTYQAALKQAKALFPNETVDVEEVR